MALHCKSVSVRYPKLCRRFGGRRRGGDILGHLDGRLLAEGRRIAAQRQFRCHEQLRTARKAFMKEHGKIFWVLGVMQYFWYSSDKRRERFVTMCDDKDVQELTWQAYMHKKLVKAKPMAHARIFFKDLAHLCGIVSP